MTRSYKSLTTLSAALAATMLMTGCAMLCPSKPGATAQLQPTSGNKAAGTVSFSQRGDKLLVVAEVTGLTPGEHGFHIHEKGDCSAPDGTSAGGHFNPSGQAHGNPDSSHHHLGDLPMLTADASGNAKLSVELDSITLAEGSGNIVGRAVIVHQKADDFQTQPTGNSGGRVACGVIAAAK
jgi:superoxide dismutase, Cu-Zn family